MTRNVMLAASSALLVVIAAVVLVLTGTISVPFLNESAAQLMTRLNQAAVSGGYSFTFTKADSSKWALAAGHRLEAYAIGDNEAVFARITSNTPLLGFPPGSTSFSWADQGVSALIPLEFAQRMNGKTVEVGVIARASQSKPSATISIVYATQQAGNSGWFKVKLTSNFELIKFTYQIPPLPSGYTKSPIIVMTSDELGKGRAAELLGIYVKPL